MPEANMSDKARTRLDASKDERTIWEAWVATCTSFDTGNHRRWWNEQGREIIKELEDNEVFRTINLIPSTLGIITTRLTANDPRWHPRKSELENVTKDELDAADALLQDVWEGEELGEFSVKEEMKLVIRNAYLQGGCLVHIRFDDDREMPVVEQHLLWDTYSDPAAQKLRDKRWLIIAVPKSVDWISEQENYDDNLKNALLADGKLAESGLKSRYIERLMGRSKATQNTALLYFSFEIEGKDIVHRVISSVHDQKGVDDEMGVLFKETLKHPEGKQMRLSTIFDIYHPVKRGRFHERPPVMDWIDPQKSINKTFSNNENHIDNFGQGIWLVEGDDIVIPRAGVQGQVIRADNGQIQHIDAQAIPGTHFQQHGIAINHYEQISGVHSESLGRQSGSAESGVALAQLQALDEQNSSDAVDNFKMFLSRVASKILFQAAMNWNKTKVLYHFDRFTNEERSLTVIGEGATRTRKNSIAKGTTSIRPFRKVDVDIVIGQFFAHAQKREELKDLLSTGYQPGVNPVLDRIVIDSYDIGVGRDIVSELRKLENPDLMVVTGNAAKIVLGEEVRVNDIDPHEFYRDFYAGKAQEVLANGDQGGAARLNQQAQLHDTMMQQGLGGAGTPDAEVPQ